MRTMRHALKVAAMAHAAHSSAPPVLAAPRAPALPVPHVRAKAPVKVLVKRHAEKAKAAAVPHQVTLPRAQVLAVRFALAQAPTAPAKPIAPVAQPFLTSN